MNLENTTPQIAEPWVQYGSFGLVAFGVLVMFPGLSWYIWRLVNRLLDEHKGALALNSAQNLEAIRVVTAAAVQEGKECREERIAHAVDDRQSRHELAGAIQNLSSQVELLKDRHNRKGS